MIMLLVTVTLFPIYIYLFPGYKGNKTEENEVECGQGSHSKCSLRIYGFHFEKQICVCKKVETRRRVSDGQNIWTHPVYRVSALYQSSSVKPEGRGIQ